MALFTYIYPELLLNTELLSVQKHLEVNLPEIAHKINFCHEIFENSLLFVKITCIDYLPRKILLRTYVFVVSSYASRLVVAMVRGGRSFLFVHSSHCVCDVILCPPLYRSYGVLVWELLTRQRPYDVSIGEHHHSTVLVNITVQYW